MLNMTAEFPSQEVLGCLSRRFLSAILEDELWFFKPRPKDPSIRPKVQSQYTNVCFHLWLNYWPE